MDPSSAHVILVCLVFLLAGGVKGVTGMGLPTVAMSLLGLWLPPTEAAALLVAPSLLTNVAQCRGPHLRRLMVALWPAWLGMVVVMWMAPALGDFGATALDARRLLGGILIVYGAWGLWRPTLPDLAGRSRGWGLLAGGLTGWVTSLTAVFVMPLLPYLQSLRLDKDAMVQALGLSFTIATLALAARLHAMASLELWSAASLWAIGAAWVGVWMGAGLRAKLSGAAFQTSLFLVFMGLGVANLLH